MKAKPILIAALLAMVTGSVFAMPPCGGHDRKAWMLERFDTDNDGQLSQTELDQARAERFAKFDDNGDGVVSLDEFKAGKLRAREERIERRFQKMDSDGDGQVSATEFAAPGAKRFAHADRDGNGVLTPEEMSELRHKRHTHGHDH